MPFPGGGSTGGLWGLAFTPDGSAAVTAFYFSGGVQGYSVPSSGVFGSTDFIPAASTTGEAVTPDGRFAFAGTREFGGSSAEGILRIAIGGGGSLTPLGVTPAPSALLLATSPDGRFLFLQTSSGMATFAIQPDGQLVEAGPSLVIPGFSPRLFDVAPDRRHVYLADYNHDSIVTVAIADNGTPTFAGETPVKGRPESVGVSPDGRYIVFYEGGGSENGIGVASLEPNGTPTVLPSFVPWTTGEPERLVFQPQPPPVARFSATAAILGQATRFDAGASERAATTNGTSATEPPAKTRGRPLSMPMGPPAPTRSL